MGLIEDIQALCGEVQDEAEFLKTLAGKASDPKWVTVDPGYTMLKDMARVQADVVLAKAQALKDAIPA